MDTSGERTRQGAPKSWAQRARSLGNTVRDGVQPLRAQLARIRERAAAAARGPAVASLTAATGKWSSAFAARLDAEMARFQREKLADFKHVVIDFVKLQLEYSQKVHAAWAALLPQLDAIETPPPA